MRLISVKMMGLLAATAMLAGCVEPTPVTHDSKGRSVVSGAQAANYFLKLCYNSNGSVAAIKRNVRRDKNFEPSKNDYGLENFYFASHKSASVDLASLANSGCSVSFVSDKPSAKAGTDAAVVLLSKIKATGIGGKKGGGRLTLKTARGTVSVSNSSKSTRNGVSIMFFKR